MNYTKKSILIFILFFSHRTFAQNYYPLPDSNAVWVVDYYSINCPQPTGYCYSFNCNIIKDTVVAGFTYHLTDWPMLPPGLNPGMYRQDSSQRKVYLNINGVDSLLYDFSLKVGDTLNQYDPANIGSIPVIVSSIDSIHNGIIYLKRWNFSGGINPWSMIEGVGSTLGLFSGINFFEEGGILRCMRIDSGLTFYPHISNSCSLVGINETSIANHIPSIFPNPIKKGDYVYIEYEYNVNYSVSLVDLLGNTQLSIRDNPSGFQLNNLEAGIYFLIIHDHNNQVFYSNKLIILQ